MEHGQVKYVRKVVSTHHHAKTETNSSIETKIRPFRWMKLSWDWNNKQRNTKMFSFAGVQNTKQIKLRPFPSCILKKKVGEPRFSSSPHVKIAQKSTQRDLINSASGLYTSSWYIWYHSFCVLSRLWSQIPNFTSKTPNILIWGFQERKRNYHPNCYQATHQRSCRPTQFGGSHFNIEVSNILMHWLSTLTLKISSHWVYIISHKSTKVGKDPVSGLEVITWTPLEAFIRHRLI